MSKKSKCMECSLKARICSVEPGRFDRILDAMSGFSDTCAGCHLFNPLIEDPGKTYRCACFGVCPAVTLHPKLQHYIHRILGWVKA